MKFGQGLPPADGWKRDMPEPKVEHTHGPFAGPYSSCPACSAATTEQGRGRYVEPKACVFPWALALMATGLGEWMVAAAFLWAGVVFLAAAQADDWMRRHGR